MATPIQPPNFGKSVKAAPIAPPTGAPIPFNPNGPPMSRSQVYVSDDTARQMAVIGIGPNDPIPPGLADQIAAVKKKFHADEVVARQEVAAVGATHRLKPPPTRDISELDPRAIAELTAFAQQYKDAASRPAAPAINMPPALAASIAAVERLTPTTTTRGETEVVIEEEIPDPATAGSPASMPSPAASELPADTGTIGRDDTCPKCFHDRRIEFKAEPTKTETHNFVVAILSGQRFFSQASLFGGELIVTFRSLLSREAEAVLQQLRYDTLDGKLTSEAHYMARMGDYRLAMGIAKVADRNGAVIVEIPNETDFGEAEEAEKTHKTIALQMHEWFIDNLAKNETARRIYGQQHRQFQRVHEALEVRAADPNFWNGIG
jgi:hypothetical protein